MDTFVEWHINIKSVFLLNGIVQPKNDNSVIIYSPSRSSKPVWMSLLCWTQRKIFWRMWETQQQFWVTIDFCGIFIPTMAVNVAPKQPGYKFSSKCLPLCSAEQRNSYRFGNTWGLVNDDRIFIFGWTIPLSRTTTYGCRALKYFYMTDFVFNVNLIIIIKKNVESC